MLKTVEELKAFFAKDTFALETCGIIIDEVSEHGARCSMPITPRHLNAGGVAQGGAIATLCDFVFAVAANAHGILTVSLNASVSFLKPGTGDRLYAEAREVSVGRTTCVYTAEVYNDAHQLVAAATVTGFRKQTA